MNSKEDQIKKFYNLRAQSKDMDKVMPGTKVNKEDISGQAISTFLKNNIVTKNKAILDAGCGEGRFSKQFIETRANLTGLDLSEAHIKIAKKEMKGGNFVVGSVTSMPFPNNSFDYVFLVDVLQHVPDVEKAIQEIHRVLKEMGTAIIIDKNKFGLHRKYLIPQIIIKKTRDLARKTYSGFNERWFFPKRFRELLAKYFREAKYEPIQISDANKLFSLFPKLSLFVAWVAKK